MCPLGLLKILRDSAMERFLTTPLEEREKLEQMKNLNIRLSSNEAIIAKLEKELNDVIAERDAEVREIFFSMKNSIHKSLQHISLSPLNNSNNSIKDQNNR
jgi:hypothetical protein